jgi:hypothetical protein
MGDPFSAGIGIRDQLGRMYNGTLDPNEPPTDLCLGMGSSLGRWLRRRWEAPRPGPNPDAEPLPPSWGGGFRLNSFSPMPSGGAVNLQTVINLDGREIANAVSRYQGRDANAPPTGGRGYDYRRGGYAPEARTLAV